MTDYSLTPETGKVEAKGQPVTLKHVAEWWVWNWPYLVIFILPQCQQALEAVVAQSIRTALAEGQQITVKESGAGNKTVIDPKFSLHYRCLPDSIDPRGSKGK
jgi:hypothetical protein